MNKRVLTLRLKEKWWKQIKSGKKSAELRLRTEYWKKRLENRTYDEIHLWSGYPRNTDTSKLLVRKWTGYRLKTVVHEEFGNDPVEVYSINVGKKIDRHARLPSI